MNRAMPKLWAFNAQLGVCAAALIVVAAAPLAHGYGFWRYGAGRVDRATTYDLGGYAWTTSAAKAYPFKWDITYPAGWTAAQKTTWHDAISGGMNDWENYATINVGDSAVAGGANVHIQIQPGTHPDDAPAVATGTQVGGKTTAMTVNFYAGDGWYGAGTLATRISQAAKHEFGHVLGLDDLYPQNIATQYVEEFIDHPLPGNPCPDRRDGYDDNIMHYLTENTVIDNDEIAGVTWLWGGLQHTLATADLVGAWNGSGGRDTEVHHGDQANPATWWDYRGSIVKGDPKEKPFIGLEFAGYESFSMTSYPAATWTYEKGAGDWVYFNCQTPGWTGNFDLSVNSKYSQERYIDGWVYGGLRSDHFNLMPSEAGLVHQAPTQWAKVFGPIPEPATLTLLLCGVLWRRRR